jgi:hypothetical protein
MGQVDEKRIAVAQWDLLRGKAVPQMEMMGGRQTGQRVLASGGVDTSGISQE